MSDTSAPSYPGGFAAILTQMEGRRDPLTYQDDEALPPPDVDFAALKSTLVDGHAPQMAGSRSTYARKLRELSQEFAGQPELLLLHGMLIAHLRRRTAPDHTAALFLRLWTEEADWLLAHLDARWLVSAITTFGDHGATTVQRRLGQSLSLLCGMMKLYETERLYSGAKPDQPFDWARRKPVALALQMDAYALGGGGLDVNMLGRLWQDADSDPVIAPLVRHLLELLISDERTVFHRLRLMRRQREQTRKADGTAPRKGAGNAARHITVPARVVKTDPATLRWGTVSLIKAPLRDIARFAAYHLDLGANRLHLHLDDPHPAAVALLSGHPQIDLVTCDAEWWAGQKKPRMKTHQLRQAWVATQTYQRADLDWLAHIDVDEFVLSPRALRDDLASLPANMAALHLPPAELLGGTQDLFKLPPRDAGQGKAVLEEIYPNFGAHLRGGFISHLEGKLIARCGIPGLRFGVHALLENGQPASNRMALPGLYLGHAHAPDWDTFRRHLGFRLQHGSYRRADDGAFSLRHILDMVQRESGDDGLRAFFTEVCEATFTLTTALQSHDMLLHRPLDLDSKVRRIFGSISDD
ncbi:MAG: glycosyltransferase family 2 protein [Rhodobacterales bacterium]